MFRDRLKLRGLVDVMVTRGKPIVTPTGDVITDNVTILDRFQTENLLVDTGKDKVIQSLTSGSINPIMRMAIGDRGTIPSDSTVPKVLVGNETALFNEIYREDMDTYILDIGTPGVHQVRFVKIFAAVDVPLTAFSNQAAPVVNEVGLITANLASPPPFPRPPVAAPALPPADEALFALRTFKSVPFEAANDIAVTIRYTVFIQ